uniref:Cytochrome c biogenesis protein transmembrane region n=1 Tax=Schimmelmannia schousboei TaxID=173468 RepID=A0A1C9C8V7_9FLOR|nr:cytochrome c biogenesis protein transmembrane region [Schimmelmannia schousboei]AOM64811.1 cytochrome c biogenesis protein transmembrane region [Schimmelmannia schousboei]
MYQVLHYIQSIPETRFYYIQQQIYKFLSLELNHFTPLILILLLISGFCTSINPCFLSTLPLTLSYINTQSSRTINKKLIIFGLMNSSIITILMAVLLGKEYNYIKQTIPVISSILIITIALNLLQIFNPFQLFINFLNQITIYKLSQEPKLQDYTIGLISGFSSASCSTPLSIIILFWLSKSHNIILGFLYLLCYLLGYITPFFCIFYFTINYINFNSLSQMWKKIIPISASIVLSIGIFNLLETIFI